MKRPLDMESKASILNYMLEIKSVQIKSTEFLIVNAKKIFYDKSARVLPEIDAKSKKNHSFIQKKNRI